MLGKQYMDPKVEAELKLKPLKEGELEPLSDKQIEALSHLMKANKPYNPTNWTMLFIGIIWSILVFWLLLI